MNFLPSTCFILNHSEWCHTLSFRQLMAPFAQIIVIHHLAVEALANDGQLATVVAGNTHMHLLSLFIFLDVGVFEATCNDEGRKTI